MKDVNHFFSCFCRDACELKHALIEDFLVSIFLAAVKRKNEKHGIIKQLIFTVCFRVLLHDPPADLNSFRLFLFIILAEKITFASLSSMFELGFRMAALNPRLPTLMKGLNVKKQN